MHIIMKKGLIYSMLFLVAACGVKKNNNGDVDGDSSATEIMVDSNGEGTHEIPTERAVYHPSETVLTDLIHTKLEVNFDWKQSRMNGVATITAKPHFYTSDVLILDAKGMDINSVKINDQALDFTYLEDVLNIGLDKDYTRDQEYTVVIDYVAKPDERTLGGSVQLHQIRDFISLTLLEKKTVRCHKSGLKAKRNQVQFGSQQ